jgi:hypothetical protein
VVVGRAGSSDGVAAGDITAAACPPPDLPPEGGRGKRMNLPPEGGRVERMNLPPEGGRVERMSLSRGRARGSLVRRRLSSPSPFRGKVGMGARAAALLKIQRQVYRP